MKIFDTFLFFNELDLLEIRLNTLDECVDFFVITESTHTFSGKSKPLYYLDNKERFKKFNSKIIYNQISINTNDFSITPTIEKYFTDRNVSYPHKSNGVKLSELSINFQREVYQRDSIIYGLIDIATENDILMISDIDEIPNPQAIRQVMKNFEIDKLYCLSQKWYMYYINVFCSQEWLGTRICNFGYLKGRSIDLLRHHLEDRLKQPGPIIEDGGWHFSFLGGHEKIKEKLSAYAYQGRRSTLFLQLLDFIFPNRIKNTISKNVDIFKTGRKFTTVELDSSFPEYIISSKLKFDGLIKNDSN